MNVVVVELRDKNIIGNLEQLETEPSIILHDAYEITTDKSGHLKYRKYPLYSHENIFVVSSLQIITLYPPNADILNTYNNLIEHAVNVELLVESD